MNLFLLALTIIVGVIAVRLFLRVGRRRRTALLVSTSHDERALGSTLDERSSRLAQWLSRAGFREPAAPTIFLGMTAGIAAIALALILLLNRFGVLDRMAESLSQIPGGFGDMLSAVATAGSYIIFTILVAAPTLVVRAARRRLVEAIEQDLASALELLATLAEAGLGFDSSIARILDSESGGRPLAREFRIYQRDTLGGINRLEALRRMARRVHVPSLSILVSALIQAEQMGSSLSETLRTQADDLRDRRKLHALLLAQALPVKLVFPLMVCFLPGIFFSTLGPVLGQFVSVLDNVLKR